MPVSVYARGFLLFFLPFWAGWTLAGQSFLKRRFLGFPGGCLRRSLSVEAFLRSSMLSRVFPVATRSKNFGRPKFFWGLSQHVCRVEVYLIGLLGFQPVEITCESGMNIAVL
jgi:hypothetical protein